MAKKTALYDEHVRLGGKIVEFAGWLLPVNYENGILYEHAAVRTRAGLFDVSHMGEIIFEGKNATEVLQKLVTNSVADMYEGQCRYALMLYPDGGIVDDLIIYKFNSEKYLLVVNAANTDKDYEWIKEHTIKGIAKNVSEHISQIALQGPLSEKIISKLTDIDKLPKKRYNFVKDVTVAGAKCLVSTTGYTGEAGYEIYLKNEDAVKVYRALSDAGKEYGITPVGLGARDTLRFECAMTLYGHELTKDFKANEVGVDFAVKQGLGFIGENALSGEIEYCRIGLKINDRGIAREHADVFDKNGEKIGFTTSGGFCPTLNGAYAMARVKKEKAYINEMFVSVRGKPLSASVVALPFYKAAPKN